MRPFFMSGAAMLLLSLSAPALAATLKGVAINGTTGLPASGDDVALITIESGRRNIQRGKTGPDGGFQFDVADLRPAYLVRVFHQGVSYNTLARRGAGSVEVRVYDVAGEVDGLSAKQHVQRFQTEGDTLRVMETIVVRNGSSPPRTLMNDHPFEIHLPPDASVESGAVQFGRGQPVMRKPAPADNQGRYFFNLPLYPGETRFTVNYRLPYRGEATIEPRILYPVEQFVVVLPDTMTFDAKTAGFFQPAPGRPGVTVQAASALTPGQTPAFRVAGKGRSEPLRAQATGTRRARSASPASAEQSKAVEGWLLAAGLIVVLASAAAGLVAHRRNASRAPAIAAKAASGWSR